jgi:phosphoribosylformimino-5-aminoimidazole carboxamide ribotide isomerase
MELIPAIDILGGHVVRLHQGRYEDATVYDADPAAVARRFEAAGARAIHVVDLDGAKEGRPINTAAIERIVERSSLAVQVGGGIRSVEVAERWDRLGVARVVVGTAAVRDPELVSRLVDRLAATVVVAIDARGDRVRVNGWREDGAVRVLDLADDVDARGAAAILYTSIERDGTGAGPDVEGTRALAARVGATVIASGGIGALDHVRQLAAAGIQEAVAGRALYEGRFDLDAGLRAARGED